MLSNNKLKYLKSLQVKKYRTLENKIVIEGSRIISEAIIQKAKFDFIYISNKHKDKKSTNVFLKQIDKYNIPYSFEDDKKINEISLTENSQGYIALVSVKNIFNDNLENFGDKILLLDEISDPGNLGTIIRTCAWFGVKSILLTNNSSDVFNPKCIRSSMGGIFYINNLKYLSHRQCIDFLNNTKNKVYCTDMNSKNLNLENINKKWILILGSESHGVNKDIQIGEKITIPNIGKMESLNVSVACGIILNRLIK